MENEKETVLRMKGICKSFPGVKALDNISFDLKKGEVHVLLGENGAGKSTLIKILSGAYQPDAGEIQIEGKVVKEISPYLSRKLGISVIYQELQLVPYLTVAENIFLGNEPMENKLLIDKKQMFQKAKELLESINSNIDPSCIVQDLSIAQRQIVEIAKSLSLDAKIIVMDEPTSSLTQDETNELFALIKRLRNQGVGIIYIGHRMEEVFEIGDRATVLRDGTYIGTKIIKETSHDELITMIVGRSITNQFPYEERPIGDTVLEVINLNNSKLKDINFQLKAGEILGIYGLLGAGRTELARAIFGADHIESGEIIINGVPRRIRNPREAISYGIGLLPEDRKNQGLSLIASVLNNTTYSALGRFIKSLFINDKQEKEAVTDLINQLSIKTPSMFTQAESLSGGNQQKVVLAKWLCSQSKIIIFDEPTRGIDVGAKVEIYKIMLELTKEGGSIIMISSELPELLGMSDRILVMSEGRIKEEFPRSEATQEKLHKAVVVNQ
ncbi:MAG TPA: sugar ABC transporter ATP-binding protein [Firmicutes bacterium]|nr:sugar ABC transporter ATP-binding protein [Bacillota bacterium]